MNIEQVKKLAKLTRSTSTIELLLDEDEEITKSIVATVDRLDKADVIYTEGSINAFIELVKNHIQSMKIENKEAEFLPIIEEYYNNTIFILSQGKKENRNKVYENLLVV